MSISANPGFLSGFDWPGLWRALSLADHNTRVVVLGTAVLGAAAGVVGTLLLLRKRALAGDALSHAALPGIALAFILGNALGGQGKALPLLLAGAATSGVVGLAAVLLIRRWTRLKEDTALGIVLTVFFGAGVALLQVIQQMSTGHAAGLESFLYGKPASLLAAEAWTIAAVSAVVIALTALFFKEFRLLCFDEGFAPSQGRRVGWLDVGMMSLVTLVTVVGLSAVGLILMIALLVTPAASARFWTRRMGPMAAVAAAIGALGAGLGAAVSATAAGWPSGAVIVLAMAAFFLLSMLLGPVGGVWPRMRERRLLHRRTARQHLLRALYEEGERTGAAVPLSSIVAKRSWSRPEAAYRLRQAIKQGLVQPGAAPDEYALTETGRREAERITRNHRLWELYLIHHADVAATHVDRNADEIEHVLGADMARSLSTLLGEEGRLPMSPHPVHEVAR